ncbi:cationic amino acid transporter 3-like isoform X2 [Lycorma delicatula]|uniref:cationic amino acid transporter 3-like isoform X2 n=1 Tax=Lycorma delicatula TaxID=130591 RepID=UPI003F50DBA0
MYDVHPEGRPLIPKTNKCNRYNKGNKNCKECTTLIDGKRQSEKLARIFTRRKTDDDDLTGVESGPKLARVLGLLDLTALGVGSTLGVGVYVLAGAVAKKDAGPAVTISFLVAAIASAFAGVCYAEFAARVPKAGSAYVYSYVSVGELTAFIIGWNLILEYVIGTASVARGLSNYVDNLLGNVMQKTLTEVLPLNISFLSPYPDFLSCGLVLMLSLLLAWGVKESTLLNNIFTGVNLLTVLTVIISGSFKVDFKNWNISKSEIPQAALPSAGEGGFMPFGVSGIMAGAAKCFYGFVGFDCVATTGEEAKNPQKNIPLSIVMCLVIIFLSYFGIASVLTLMYPYYLQNADAPLPYVFDEVGMPAVKLLVNCGAIFALCTSLLGSMFPLTRLLYAMAHDGLLFKSFASINTKTRTPIFATCIGGLVGGIMAAIFNLEQLIDMMSIGTLLAYTIVAICVLVLRYRDPNPAIYERPILELQNGMNNGNTITTIGTLSQLFNMTGMKYPNSTTQAVSESTISLLILVSAGVCLSLIYTEKNVADGEIWAIALLVLLVVFAFLTVLIIYRQPQNNTPLSFKVPWVPVVPALSIFMNTYLMLKLDMQTWIRFGLWLIIGMLIYIFYSIPNSVEGIKDRLSAAERKPKASQKSPNEVTKF